MFDLMCTPFQLDEWKSTGLLANGIDLIYFQAGDGWALRWAVLGFRECRHHSSFLRCGLHLLIHSFVGNECSESELARAPLALTLLCSRQSIFIMLTWIGNESSQASLGIQST